MTIREIVQSLDSFDDNQTIYFDPTFRLSADTRAEVFWAPEDSSELAGASGMKCFLDVWHAKEVIHNKARQRGLSKPTTDQMIDLLLEYARTNA